jgi:chromosome segregation ATPase
VPDPEIEFAGEDLNTLKELLEETRAERARAEDRLEELREELAAARGEWKQQVCASLPAI